MISFEDRIALVRAGYTASQIADFDNLQVVQPEPQTEPSASTLTDPVHEETENTQTPDFAAIMQSINNSMTAMLAAMQAQNIKSSDMGNPEKETTGDILAKLLNP